MKNNTAKLNEIGRELMVLKGIIGQLSWDESTFMPPSAAKERGEQLAMLNNYYHRILVDPALKSRIDDVDISILSPSDKANIRILSHERLFHANIPEILIEKTSIQASISQQNWVEAKQQNNFALFSANLDKLIQLKKEIAEHVGYEKSPYNALLSEYEPGLTIENFKPIMISLEDKLLKIVSKIESAPKKPMHDILNRHIANDLILDFSTKTVQDMGFNSSYGRIDISSHPFCQSNVFQTDVRLTTRFVPEKPIETFYGLMHEAGHGIYEQGLPENYRGQLCSLPASTAIHESQSRWWENIIGRSPTYWYYLFPKFQETFKTSYQDVSMDDFILAINQVKRSQIRVSADEVTYNLHIIFRTELEQMIFENKIKTSELPEAWNEKCLRYFGSKPASFKEGILQDIHWAIGIFGYFPTYTLGNLCAAQFSNSFEVQNPNFKDD
ncbi:MAG: carboxypeptidase M32, partial [Proteobacteria bacterium]|nr:carboxypeptidase M32 [Pseudomonadota bacterium]